MKFKVGDHAEVKENDKCCAKFWGHKFKIIIVSDSGKVCREENGDLWDTDILTLCLPEKWAIKTDRQEFVDWLNDKTDNDVIAINGFCGQYIHNTGPSRSWFGLDQKIGEHIEITFEYWCRVHRPDLLSVPEIPTNSIPEKSYVKRSPENADILIEWFKFRNKTNWYGSDFLECDDTVVYYDGCWDYIEDVDLDINKEITFEQWKTIPEVAEWLQAEWVKFAEGSASIVEASFDEHFKMLEKSEIPINPERKIVGYELSDPNDSTKWSGLWTTYNFDVDGKVKYAYENKGNHWAEKIGSVIFEKMLSAGIFKPVYEEEKMTRRRTNTGINEGNRVT